MRLSAILRAWVMTADSVGEDMVMVHDDTSAFVNIEDATIPDLIVITGMSGAGRSEAMRTFEDLGYFCIDNLPPSLLQSLVQLTDISNSPKRKLAVVCDLRSQAYSQELTQEFKRLAALEITYAVVFLDASDDVLYQRYSSLRRRHPLSEKSLDVRSAISLEREQLASVRELADLVIDTTQMKARDLRKLICESFSELSAQENMNVKVFSFGFKHGLPLEADIIIDVRFLPNPYYDPQMRALTGFDDPVYMYVMERSETKAFMQAWTQLLDAVMPGYVSEGKRNISIGIGCTGGQHRSVSIARATAAYLKSGGYVVTEQHRDLRLAER